jgi:hypothetical protein
VPSSRDGGSSAAARSAPLKAARRPASVYEHPEYLRASATHVGARDELVGGEACLPVLELPDGSRRTVYGLPRPYGDDEPAPLAALADELSSPGAGLTAVLSPLEPGPTLARLLCSQGATTVAERPIALCELDGEERFDRRARRAIRTALSRGACVSINPLEPWFGPFYRAAMQQLRAHELYFFADGYFTALAALPHYVVGVEDDHGTAAAALFLHDEHEAYYHLGGRRDGVEPVVGAMSLALAEGIREAERRGCHAAILGGGRSDDPADSLLAFKRQLAATVRPRVTVAVAATVRPRITAALGAGSGR